MTPPNLTNAEVGALLMAIGEQMFQNDLCFGAALEDGHSHEDILERMAPDLRACGCIYPRLRGLELLKMTGEEIINFVEGF